MMSCNGVYVEPIEDLVVQERKTRLLSLTIIVITFEKSNFIPTLVLAVSFYRNFYCVISFVQHHMALISVLITFLQISELWVSFFLMMVFLKSMGKIN